MRPRRQGAEYIECKALSKWLDITGWKYSYVPMDTFTPYRGVISRNSAMGVHKGVPDYLVCVKKRDGSRRLCFVEMKKPGGGVLSEEQKAWLAELRLCQGTYATMCHTAKEAAEFLLKVQKDG